MISSFFFPCCLLSLMHSSKTKAVPFHSFFFFPTRVGKRVRVRRGINSPIRREGFIDDSLAAGEGLMRML